MYEEWKDTQIVQDLIRFLDNVLEYFIRLAPKQVSRAVHSATKERALGLGTLGWHSYLQSKMIPFESGGFGGAMQEAHKIYKLIKSRAVEESLRLGSIRGEADDCAGSGMRNSHLLAIAPNATSSKRVGKYGTSPSKEPWASNAFNGSGRAGSFLIKNGYLEKLLESKGRNNKEVWKSIILNEGSVQHLDFLTEHEKKVFKTFKEIDQMYIIELASIIQPHVCQAQSTNLSVRKEITMPEMVHLHVMGWLKGLKTFYYCRAESANKATASKEAVQSQIKINLEPSDCIGCEG